MVDGKEIEYNKFEITLYSDSGRVIYEPLKFANGFLMPGVINKESAIRITFTLNNYNFDFSSIPVKLFKSEAPLTLTSRNCKEKLYEG